VEIKLQDYRDERGTYDGIASIEMFEAVGEKYWPVYFDTLRERLKPGKQATLQIITVQDKRWEIYKRGVDFIQKYIFPGGMLPCAEVLRQQVKNAGWRSQAPSSSAKATRRRCGAGTRPSTTAGTRWPSWASTTGSVGCGTSTSVPAPPPSSSA
jgi:cyclopropane fatty-acyl-phospholipid synthase-like methyltransferase